MEKTRLIVNHDKVESLEQFTSSPAASHSPLINMIESEKLSKPNLKYSNVVIAAEQQSSYPIAKPVIKFFNEQGAFLDDIETYDEDPFTLEKFEVLMQLHKDSNKQFLIARVTTLDELSGAYFYSYYAAHHINKVLFRTQPELGLLHRMKANNPLNNMLIHGDVHYFLVDSTSLEEICEVESESLIEEIKYEHPIISQARRVSRTIGNFMSQFSGKNSDNPRKSSILSNRRRSSILSNRNLNRRLSNISLKSEDEPHGRKRNLHIIASPSITSGIINNAPLTGTYEQIPEIEEKDLKSRDVPLMHIDTSIARKKQSNLSSLPETPLLFIDGSEKSFSSCLEQVPLIKSRRQVFRATYYANDNDFLMNSSVRQLFRANALETSDAVLFTIPVESNVTPRFADNQEHPHPALPGFRYTFENSNTEQNDDMNEDNDLEIDDNLELTEYANMVERRRLITKIIVIVYLISSIIFVKYIVSKEAALEWAFKLGGLLCILLGIIL